jgi:lambda family phage minor tail protein L
MTLNAKLAEDVQAPAPGALLTLYEIDFSTTGLSPYPVNMYLYSGVAANYGNIAFGGDTYLPFPLETTGFKESADGPLPRPVMTISNIGGVMSAQMVIYNDFIGAKVNIYRTFAKYLDGEPAGDPAARMTEIYFVEQKKAETQNTVELQLVSAIDVMDAQLPSRNMLTNTCLWRYKSDECSWPGTDSGLYFNANDVSVVDQADDTCSKRLEGCKKRFCDWNGSNFRSPNAKLPMGAFPALGRTT